MQDQPIAISHEPLQLTVSSSTSVSSSPRQLENSSLSLLHKCRDYLFQTWSVWKQLLFTKEGLVSLFQIWKHNTIPAIVIALSSLPTVLSLSISTNAAPSMFIASALWATVAHALFGNCYYNVLGPTGSTAGIIASYARIYGVESISIFTIISGMITLLIALLKLDKYLVLIPSAVVHGFTLGIAVKLLITQTPFILGIEVEKQSALSKLFQSLYRIQETNIISVFLCALFVSLFYYLFKKKAKIPWLIVQLVTSILVGLFFIAQGNPIRLLYLNTYGDVQFDTQRLIYFPKWQAMLFPFDSLSEFQNFLLTCVELSVVATFEVILCAKMATGLTDKQFNERREVFALGVSSIAAGVLGGVPISASFPRVNTAVAYGASSMVVDIINAICLALVSLAFEPLFGYIPRPLLAATLAIVVYRMVDARNLEKIFKLERTMFYLALFVALMTVTYNSATALGLGMILSLLYYTSQYASVGLSEVVFGSPALQKTSSIRKVKKSYSNYEIDEYIRKSEENLSQNGEGEDTLFIEGVPFVQDEPALPSLSVENENKEKIQIVHQQQEEASSTVTYYIEGELTYFNSYSHIYRLKKMKRMKKVIISLKNVYYCDLDGLEALESVASYLERKGVQVVLIDCNNFAIQHMLNKSTVLQSMIQAT